MRHRAWGDVLKSPLWLGGQRPPGIPARESYMIVHGWRVLLLHGECAGVPVWVRG